MMNNRPSRFPKLSRRAFLRWMLGVALAPAVGWLYAAEVELRWLQIERVNVDLPRLPAAFHGLTIGQIGDFHVGPYIGAAEVRAAVQAVLALNPDLIVITGDFVSSLESNEAAILETELAALHAPLGCYAIMGNHDWWNDRKIVRAAVERAGITMLQNAAVPLTRAGQTLHVVGLDDYMLGKTRWAQAVEHVPADAPILLLIHEPDYADVAALDARCVLQLSGHSHGGQVRVPGLGLWWLPKYAHRYPIGLQRVQNMWVYTNRGIGVTGVPVRFNCRPEVTLLTLEMA